MENEMVFIKGFVKLYEKLFPSYLIDLPLQHKNLDHKNGIALLI